MVGHLVEEDRWYTRLPNSINNHAIRLYWWSEHGINSNTRFEIYRETDSYPRSYSLYVVELIRPDVQPPYPQPKRIMVGGKEHWGEGLSWPNAIVLAEQAIKEFLENEHIT